MARSLTIHKPRRAELRQLQQVLEAPLTKQRHRRADALVLYAAGLNARQIAAALDVHCNTIYADLHAFEHAGTAAVHDFQPRGARTRLTSAQLTELWRLADQSPTEVGLPYGRWSLSKFRDYLIHSRRLLKAISREHLRRVLKKKGFVSAVSNANSSATTRNDWRFWLGFD
jgi:transposase